MNAPDFPAAAPPSADRFAFPWSDADHFDEMHARPALDDGSCGVPAGAGPAPLTPAWSEFFRHCGPAERQELSRRAAQLARQLRDNGVTYNVYADANGPQRPWSLDLFPLIVSPERWSQIEAGVLQHVRVLETVMRDIYGERIQSEANYTVIRTKYDGDSTVFSVGFYRDTIVRTPEGLKLQSRLCIYDSEMIANSVIYPI